MSREDLDEILNEAIAFATFLIEKNGEFYPFAVIKDSQGNLKHFHHPTHEEFPTSEKLREGLFASLRHSAQRNEIVASAVVSNTSLTERSTLVAKSAIRLELESATDVAVTCYLPFAFADGSLKTEDLVAEAGRARTFRADHSPST
jgi:hypothetical protein